MGKKVWTEEELERAEQIAREKMEKEASEEAEKTEAEDKGEQEEQPVYEFMTAEDEKIALMKKISPVIGRLAQKMNRRILRAFKQRCIQNGANYVEVLTALFMRAVDPDDSDFHSEVEATMPKPDLLDFPTDEKEVLKKARQFLKEFSEEDTISKSVEKLINVLIQKEIMKLTGGSLSDKELKKILEGS